MPVCLSFAGVAGCFPFHAGALDQIQVLASKDTEYVYAGLSSGSVIATLLALGLDTDQMIKEFEKFNTFFTRWYHHPVTVWFNHTKRLFMELMPEDAYQKVSGKLYIGYSSVTPFGLKSKVINTYTSNEDLMMAILASCHLIPYRWWPVGIYRGEIVCDGAFSLGVIRPEGMITVAITAPMVHSQVFWSDWFPTTNLDKLRRLYDAGASFVNRHEDYFKRQLAGDKDHRIILPRYFNPFRWMRRLVLLFLLWKCWLRLRPWLQTINFY